MATSSGLSLQQELEASSRRAAASPSRRPILTHLNADTSWLLQLPYPDPSLSKTGRPFFNILIDPWLEGSQTDFASWFSIQSHVVKSSVATIAELEDILRKVQAIESEREPQPEPVSASGDSSDSNRSPIDAVVISHEDTDHCHHATLLQVPRDVPVIANERPAAKIRGWGHFESVTPIDTLPQTTTRLDWRRACVAPLPDWMGITRIYGGGGLMSWLSQIHAALCIVFRAPTSSSPIRTGTADKEDGDALPDSKPDIDTETDADTEAVEAIVYTPHGLPASALAPLADARPPIKTLALLHGLHDVGVWGLMQVNLGAHNGLRAQRVCGAAYWVATHDEVKTAGGLVGWMLRRDAFSVQQALDREKALPKEVEETKEAKEATSPAAAVEGGSEDVRFFDLKSGESLVLL